MADRKEPNDATTGNGDWNSWRRLVLSQLEKLEARIIALEKRQQQDEVSMAILRTRIALGVVMVTLAANAFIAWVLRELGH